MRTGTILGLIRIKIDVTEKGKKEIDFQNFLMRVFEN